MDGTQLIFGSLTAKITYDLITEVLGPSARYLGTELKGLTEVGVTNIKRVFENAQKRNKDLAKTTGLVPPRLLQPLLRSAYFCEDEVVTSYLGGLLCSSRSEFSKDDRSIGILKIIDELSTYSLRLHYIIYSSLMIYPKQDRQLIRKWLSEGSDVSVLFDEESLRLAMDFAPGEDSEEILEHASLSLNAHGLCSEGFRSLRPVGLKKNARFFRLSLRGIELFCWGNGYSAKGKDYYFSGEIKLDASSDLAIEPIETKLGKVCWIESSQRKLQSK